MLLRRLQPAGWSEENNYAQLPNYQKIWLDESHKQQRRIDDDWLDIVITDCARWIMSAYKKVLGHQAISLDDTDLSDIKKIIRFNKEDLQ